MLRALRRAFERSRRKAAERRAVDALLDRLFSAEPKVLAAGRLAQRHRHRLNVLEVDHDADGVICRLLLGIVRHPHRHPLAGRGDEVLELLEYLPQEPSLRNVGGANLTRARERAAEDD